MIWLQSHAAKPEVKNHLGHGWARGGDESLEHKLYEKQCAPLEVRDITHLYCNDKDCKVSGKCPCLLAGLPCIESCACSSTDCSSNTNSSTARHGESDDEVSDNDSGLNQETVMYPTKTIIMNVIMTVHDVYSPSILMLFCPTADDGLLKVI